MSWKDVRKNAKEPGGDGKGDVDDAIDDGADGMGVITSTLLRLTIIPRA